MKKKKSASQSAFFNLRTVGGLLICLFGFVLTLFATGVLPGNSGQTSSTSALSRPQAKPGTQKPDVVKMFGPVSQDLDLRLLPYIAPSGEHETKRLVRHPFPLPALTGSQSRAQLLTAGGSALVQQTAMTMAAVLIPSPLMTFDAIDSNLSGCGCLPPDSEGDVGSKNYVSSMNSSIMIFDKSGNALAGPITYNSFFAAMGTSTGLRQQPERWGRHCILRSHRRSLGR